MPTASSAPDALLEWLAHALPPARPEGACPPLGARLTQALRRAIVEGVVPPGARLPSTRALAAALGVARNTVVPAFEQLAAEGVVEAGRGSGTFACRLDPAPRGEARPAARSVALAGAGGDDGAPPAAPLSRRGQRYRRHPMHAFWTPRPFCPGSFDPGLFPIRTWTRLQQRRLRHPDPALLGAGEPGGLPALREAIAAHVHAMRGVRCRPEQVIVTDGTAESIDLVARLMCDPGDLALLEDPGYWAAAHVLGDHGLRLRAQAVDAQGLPVPRAPGRGAAPRLAYLTPSNQFPTGGVMPLARRLEWLRFAAAHGTLLLEDDYDSELRLEGPPFPSLQGQDTAGRVIYLGTFSKTMYPGLRVAFAVVPQALQQVFADASADFYRDGDQVAQQVLADFLREGHYAAHLRNLRREYALRREAMSQALRAALPRAFDEGRLCASGGARGGHLTLALPASVDDRAVARAARARGVAAMPLSVYALQVAWRGLVLSYAATPVERIVAHVAPLAEVLAEALA